MKDRKWAFEIPLRVYVYKSFQYLSTCICLIYLEIILTTTYGVFYHFQGTSYTHSQLTLRLALRKQLHSYPFSSLQKKENVHRRVVWTVPITQNYFIHMFIQMWILSYNSYNSTVKRALLVYVGFYKLSDPAGKPGPKALCFGLLDLKFQCSSSSPPPHLPH